MAECAKDPVLPIAVEHSNRHSSAVKTTASAIAGGLLDRERCLNGEPHGDRAGIDPDGFVRVVGPAGG